MASKDSNVVESVPEYTSKELRLILVGKTGAGKSKLGCNLLDKKDTFPSSTLASSTTEKCAFGQKVLDSESTLVVVDTPGVFDTKINNKDTVLEIIRSLTILSPGPHVIAFVVRVGKLTEEENNALTLLVDLFSEKVYKHMIIIFTRKDDLEDDGISEEEYINSTPDQFQEFLRKVNHRHVFINNRAKGDKLKSEISAVMQLVDELISINNGEYYTSKMYIVVEEKLATKKKEIEDSLKKNGQDIAPGRVRFLLRKDIMTNTPLIMRVAMGICATMLLAGAGLIVGGCAAVLVGAEVVVEELITGAVATPLTGLTASGFWCVLKTMYKNNK